MLVFGDSFADQGNLIDAVNQIREELGFGPYFTYEDQSGTKTHAVTNGKTVVQFIADALGADLQLIMKKSLLGFYSMILK